MNITPSLANLPIQTTPRGTPTTALLHGILTGHDPTLHYDYVYIYVYVYVYVYVYIYVYSLSRSPRALYCCVKSPPIIVSGM